MRSTIKAAALGLATAGALALPDAVSAGGGGHCQSQEVTTGSGIALEIERACYSPTVLYVGLGDAVTWSNRDAVPHTVTGVFGSWGNYEQFGLDESMTFTFDEAGVLPYFCVVHPTMQGVVVVGDGAATASPNVATTIDPPPGAAVVSNADAPGIEATADTSTVASNASAPLAAAAGVGGLTFGAIGASWAPRLRRRP